jgi:hypothetical protein
MKVRRAYVVEAFGRAAWSAVAALLVALVIASPAGAAPKGIFSVFRSCPASELKGRATNPICVYEQTAGGVLRIGRTTVPIDRPITVQAGGLNVEGGWDLVPPSGGTIISKTPLEVPGGLSGVVQCGAIGGRLAQASCGAAEGTEVMATIEAVPSSSDPAFINTYGIFGEKPLLVLPVRVHLGNVFLGNSCYLGSGSHPMMLEMTFWTTSPSPPNKPISGHKGSFDQELENDLEALAFGESSLVDNAFSVPAAEGCAGQSSSLIDPMVDAKLGLPSTAGHNTAILDAEVLELAAVENVIKSEEYL